MLNVCAAIGCFFIIILSLLFISFFFNDTATTEIYTLSLHDALPIFVFVGTMVAVSAAANRDVLVWEDAESLTCDESWTRSEEHTSELQSRLHLVCRLLLEKKKKKKNKTHHNNTHYKNQTNH